MSGNKVQATEDSMRYFNRPFAATALILLLNLQSLSQENSTEKAPHLSLPRLEFTGSSSFDFGDIYRGQKATHLFTIKNSGNDTLVIKNVSASCGCTAAMALESVIPPQSTAELSVTFNSEGYGGRTHKTVTVISNDPVDPSRQVSITANVQTVLEPDPAYLFIHGATVDSVTSSVIKLTNTTAKPVRILSAEANLAELRVEPTKKILKPKEKADLLVSYKPSKDGPAYGEIILKTDFQPQPTVSIRLTANAHR